MEDRVYEACERFRLALEAADARAAVRAALRRKGRTLYVVSPEARELRRVDAILAEGGRR